MGSIELLNYSVSRSFLHQLCMLTLFVDDLCGPFFSAVSAKRVGWQMPQSTTIIRNEGNFGAEAGLPLHHSRENLVPLSDPFRSELEGTCAPVRDLQNDQYPPRYAGAAGL
jgi:hypothetical protein